MTEILAARPILLEKLAKLSNPLTGDNDYDETFLQHAKESVSFMENNMLDPLREHNPDLNRPIEINEIKRVVIKSKNGKSTGIDDIPDEVLKFDCVTEVIHRLFVYVKF